MHQSSQTEARPQGKQKWQEPVVVIERSLTGNAQDLGPLDGPSFGPLSGSVGS
ncbi:MAG: hypothetical protein ABTQ73_04560 [Caldilineales bacterium]